MIWSKLGCWSQVSRAVVLRPNRRVHLLVSRGRDLADRYAQGFSHLRFFKRACPDDIKWRTSAIISLIKGAASLLTCITSSTLEKSVSMTPPYSSRHLIAALGSWRATRRAILLLGCLDRVEKIMDARGASRISEMLLLVANDKARKVGAWLILADVESDDTLNFPQLGRAHKGNYWLSI